MAAASRATRIRVRRTEAIGPAGHQAASRREGKNNQMNRLTKTAAIAAIATLGIFGTTGAASAATINHGQCVSGAVKAGVEGAAVTAIAKNNSLVGAYGSTTCPAIDVAPTPDKAISDIPLTWDFNDGTTHVTG